jgi:hypothetical protein
VMIMVPDWITKTMVKQTDQNKEAAMLSRMHNDFMPANNLIFNGKHHEIYLSDPRKVAPGQLRTIIRQPVKKAAHLH